MRDYLALGGVRLITARQVVLMRQKLMKRKTQQEVASASEVSERSVRI